MVGPIFKRISFTGHLTLASENSYVHNFFAKLNWANADIMLGYAVTLLLSFATLICAVGLIVIVAYLLYIHKKYDHIPGPKRNK